MLPDYGRYYGSVLTHIVDQYGAAVSIEKLSVGVQGFYLLNGKTPLYVKFSRSRKGPWSFNFRRDHQTEYRRLVKTYGDCITALVCGKDGIVALNDAQIRQILDQEFEEQESVSVRRKLNHMYSVRGANGELSQKVSRDSLMSHLGIRTKEDEVAANEGSSLGEATA